MRRAAGCCALSTCGLLTGLSVVTSWGISQLGWSQATLSLAVLVQQVGAALGFLAAGGARSAERRVEPRLVALGAGLVAGALLAVGIGAPRLPGLLWGALFAAGAGAGLSTTAAAAVVGINVARRGQGQVQAAALALGYVGAAAGCLAGPWLYSPGASAVTLRAAKPFLAGAAQAGLAAALALVGDDESVAGGGPDDSPLAGALLADDRLSADVAIA